MQSTNQVPLGKWYVSEPGTVAAWLAQARVPWWIAGGWALDLFLNDVSRAHTDLDVGVLRQDVADVLAALPGWEHFEAHDGTLARLTAGALPRPYVHSLWCRPASAADWTLEIMLDESEGGDWLFRRDPSIRRPLSTMTRLGAGGIRYLAPEVQLLYKSKSVRPHDQADFVRVMPRLGQEARSWLRGSLEKVSPDHAWLRAMAEFEESSA